MWHFGSFHSSQDIDTQPCPGMDGPMMGLWGDQRANLHWFCGRHKSLSLVVDVELTVWPKNVGQPLWPEFIVHLLGNSKHVVLLCSIWILKQFSDMMVLL